MKNTLPAKLQWDGTTHGFQEYKIAIEGFYTQQYSDYLFDKRFQRLYVKHGAAHVIDHPDLPKYIKITRPQLEEAKVHLFGAIKQTTKKSNTVKKFIYRHQDERDGILVWIELCNTQDNDGNTDVREAKLIRITNQRFSNNYPGGLMRYLDDMDDAYAGLDFLGNKFTSRQKMQNLLNNLSYSHTDGYLVNHCRDFFNTFEECVSYLRKEAVRRADVAGQTGIRHAKLSTMNDNTDASTDVNEMIQLCDQLGLEPNGDNIRIVNKIMRDPELYIQPKAWNMLVEIFGIEGMKKYLDLKRTKEDPQNSGTKPSENRANQNLPPIAPKQYNNKEAKANLTSIDYSDTESDSDDEKPENVRSVMQVLKDLYSERQLFMVKQDTTSSFGTETITRLIFDTGADTSVIGKGWRITHFYGPTISLVGFDSQHARKKDLRICSAETILEHPSGNKYLLRIHQAVYNPSANDSLLSEYQLSEAGCQIDSKPMTHQFPNGEKGTQSFKLPEIEDIFIFDISSCLATLIHRVPTLEESETLDPIDITNLQNWEPSHHNYGSTGPQHVTCYKAMMIMDDPTSSIFYDCLPDVDTVEVQGEPTKKALDWSVCVDTIEDKLLTQFNVGIKDFKDHNLDPYNVADYMRLALMLKKEIVPKKVKRHPICAKTIQPCLAYLPISTIQNTLQCTTQLAKWHTKVPMQRHWQPRFPFLNVHRLREPVATDTFFANCKAIGGDTCAQVFYGIQSHMINVYPMLSENEGPNAYEDFIREEGCPTLLRRDNSKMQTGQKFTMINRHFCVKDGYTEPYHPHQNPAENQAVRWLKSHAQTVMNITGAPNYVWSFCMLWIADVHNIVAHEALEYRTPYEKRHGTTPDISAYILFHFWEQILYLDSEQSYPDSKELPGYFLGVAKHSGDALTFKILTADGSVFVRSVIRSASGRPSAGFRNQRIIHPSFVSNEETLSPPHVDPVGHNGGDKTESNFNQTTNEETPTSTTATTEQENNLPDVKITKV